VREREREGGRESVSLYSEGFGISNPYSRNSNSIHIPKNHKS